MVLQISGHAKSLGKFPSVVAEYALCSDFEEPWHLAIVLELASTYTVPMSLCSCICNLPKFVLKIVIKFIVLKLRINPSLKGCDES